MRKEKIETGVRNEYWKDSPVKHLRLYREREKLLYTIV